VKTTINIRDFYAPVQPTVKSSGENVYYCELLPDEKLKPFIYCYWELKTAQPLETGFTYKVIADGCIDIFFEIENPSESFVMGFCNKHSDFPLERSFDYVGVRFLPTFFTQIFGINASVLTNKVEDLNSIIPETSKFIADKFSADFDLSQIKKNLDDYFIDRLSKTEFEFDKRLYSALEIIFRNSGVVNVRRDLSDGISPRQLRRLFEKYVGVSPKAFAKVVRFQAIVNAKPSRQSLRENKIFFDVGYYDQAHFIREFKYLYGLTPNKAFDE
jgi:hypothetical protein